MRYIRKNKKALWMQCIPKTPRDAPGGNPATLTQPAPERLAPPKPVRKPWRYVRPVSKRRQKVTAEYSREARAAVSDANRRGLKCPVVQAIAELRNGVRYGWPVSDRITEVHHRFGRNGALLLWKPGWLLLSKAGHRWVHAHIAESRKHGWIAQPGDWNNPRVMDRPTS